MTPLKISLFGVPRLERAGKSLDVSRRKVVALLAYLAVTDQAQSRDALAGLLWPDYDQSSARTNLRRDLSRLKRAIGAEHLAADRNQIALVRSNGLSVDVATFEAALERVRQHHPAARQLCEACATALTAAVALYQDDFMAGFALPDSAAFDEWQFFQTEELRRKLAEVLQRLIDWHVSRTEFERAVEYGRRWVALDGLHEPAQRRLMQLYAWSGQRAAAMRQYQEAARLLEEELGEAPEEETVLLYESIRNRELAAPRTRTGPKEESAEARYEVLDLLAVGGHAEVYYGRDRISGIDVVIKRLKPELLARGTTYLQRFIREAKALSHLKHPNIVRMLATFEEAGQHSIVMEHVPSGNLRQLLDRESPLPVERAVNIALELADALARAHHLNIMHRDLKPDNILLAADGTPRLTDFGLARLRRDEVRVTRTGAVVGSPAYMSPEALRGEELDPRSDIWSFGVLLYEILAGRRPFEGQQLTPVLVSILQDKAPPVTEFRPDTPPALVNLLQRMLQKDPERRPASMRQVAAELEAIALGRTVDDRPQMADGGPLAVEDSGLQSPVSNLPPFVGREQTLGRLQTLLQRATGGIGAVAVVMGEAGQGKTSLLQAFVQKSLEQFPRLLVAGGNCNAYTGSGDPYLPFREILEALTTADRPQTADRSSGVLEILLETGPDLLDTFIPARNVVDRLPEKDQRLLTQVQSSAARRMPSALQQQDLFEQFTRVMKALSRRRPLLLFLDDLQWVDQGSANLLLHLGRSIENHAIMILGAYRPAEVSVGRDGGRHPLETPLFELQRLFGDVSFDLSREEGRLFIDALLDSEPNRLDDAFRETLYRQTGGHPLFTLELLRGMQERGDLITDKDGNRVAQLDLDWHTLPARVEGAIGERISRLSPQLRELLEVASVEGEEFTAETVARALGTDERLTMRQISGELDRKHLLVRALDVRHMGGGRLSRYRFRHILIQRYLYNSMDAVEKVYQHEAVARALEALYGDETTAIAPQLARHLDLAQLPVEAAVYFQQSGDQARRVIALEEAARYFEAALARWPSGDPGGRAVLLRKLGECQWIMGELQDALVTYEECFNLFEEVGDMHGAGAVQRSVGRLYWEIGERERSLEHYHRSLIILEKIPESVELAWTISSLSQMHMLASQYDEAIEWGERALKLAERLGADDVKTHALNNVGVAYMETGQLERGKELVRKSLGLAMKLGLPHDACRAYLNLGEVPAGAYDERRAVLQELAEYATSIRAPLYAGSAHIELGNIEWELGEWRAAQARRAEIQTWMERAPSMGYLRGINSVFLGRMYNDLGQFEKALQVLEPVLPVARRQNEVQIIGPHMGQLARALAAQNREQEAVAILREMLGAIEAQPYVHRDSTPALLFSCIWFAESKPTADALEMAMRFRDLLERGDDYGTKPDVAAAWREARGVLLVARESAAEAVPHFQSAAEQWREMGRLYDEARAAIALGRALEEVGDGAEMEAAYERAASLLDKLTSQLDSDEDQESFRKYGELHRALRQRKSGSGSRDSGLQSQPAAATIRGRQPFATRFVGRQKEVAEITRLLSEKPHCKLLTLVGPGGIGKTRLALAAAEALYKVFTVVSYVDLTPLAEAEQIVPAISASLALTISGGDPKQLLLDYLRRYKTLLVMDNFEHLLAGAPLLTELLAAAPDLKMLVTSRERLELSTETVYTVQGLDFPLGSPGADFGPEAAESSAVKLLLQQGRLLVPDYTPDADDLAAMVRIARLVQGMPLALVLAAGWLEVMPFSEIAEEIAADLDFLSSEMRDLPERQHSVRATFNTSWRRLEPDSQVVFRKLAVFRGGFTRHAAQAVTGASAHALRTLVNKSFLSVRDSVRFDVHELLRQFGEEELQKTEETDEIRDVQSQYYLREAAQQTDRLKGSEQLAAMDHIDADLENVRAAWIWAVQRGYATDIDASLEALAIFFAAYRRNPDEFISLLQLARDRLVDRSALDLRGSRLLTMLAQSLSYAAKPEENSKQDLEQSVQIARQHNAMLEEGLALYGLGHYQIWSQPDVREALAYYQEALHLFEAAGEAYYTAIALGQIAYCQKALGLLPDAIKGYERAVTLRRKLGDHINTAVALAHLGECNLCLGHFDLAEKFNKEALLEAQAVGSWFPLPAAEARLALQRFLRGEITAGAQQAEAALRTALETSAQVTGIGRPYALAVMSVAKSIAGEYPAGRVLAEQAVEVAANLTVLGQILSQWALSVALLGQDEEAAARQAATRARTQAQETNHVGLLSLPLPVLAAIQARQGAYTEASDLLRQAFSAGPHLAGWLEKWPLIKQLQNDL